MNAVVIENGHLHFKERPDPLPSANEILIQVITASLNGADLLQLKGLYPPPADAPQDIPGLDLAGNVIAVGSNVRDYLVGDRIMALVSGGAQAELALADFSHCIKLPDSVSFVQAGGFMETFLTAYDALKIASAFDSPKSILVTGAAGGVGTSAIQLAALNSHRVVASTRHIDFATELQSLGAEVVCEPSSEESHGPYDVIIELIGGSNIVEHLNMLTSEGVLVLIGVSAGSKIELNVLTLMNKRAKLIGRTLRSRTRSEKAILIKELQEVVFPHFASGKIKVPIAGIYPMQRPDRAYGAFAQGKKLGKILLTTEDSLVTIKD